MKNKVNDPEFEQNIEKGALEKQTEAVESQIQKDLVSTDTQLVDKKLIQPAWRNLWVSRKGTKI